MRYAGGKGGAGMYQTIINQIPPHRVYLEPFVGGGNVFERKKPAASSILADLDASVIERWRGLCTGRDDVEVLQADAFELLSSFQWQGDEFVYLDPPYHHSTRARADYYKFELDDAAHRRLLDLVAALPVRWALSGYRCAIYDDASSRHGWRRVDFQAMTQRGLKTESLWMNYAEPAHLADYAHVGSNFRERERIKRKASRWVRRFEELPQLERAAIVMTMADRGLVSPPAAMGDGTTTSRGNT